MADEIPIDYRALLARYTAYESHRSVILDALRIAVAAGGYEYDRERYEAVLEALEAGAQEPLSATCTGPGCGEQFADSETGEYLFATWERMERLLHADGWAADPVLCPAGQQEAGHDPLA